MCVKPLKGWIIGKTAEGKNQIKITSFEVDHLERYVNGALVSVSELGNVNHVSSLRPTGSQLEVQRYDEYITIPCGHCIECLKDRGQQWTNRCLLEYAMCGGQNAHFVWLYVFI